MTGIERTLIDLVAAAGDADAVAALLAQAAQGRSTTTERLRRAFEASNRPGRGTALSLLADVRAGAHSALEVRYLRRVERAHFLPVGERQVRDGANVRDVRYGAYATLVELDGIADHTGSARLRDLARDNAAAAVGWVTLRFGWADVAQRPCTVAAQVHAALTQRGLDRPLRSCGGLCGADATQPRPRRAYELVASRR